MSLDQLKLPNWLSRGVADLFPLGNSDEKEQNLALRLLESEEKNTPLRIKLGIDPTGSDIHLGHSILFRKLRAFQDAGHIACLLYTSPSPRDVEESRMPSSA